MLRIMNRYTNKKSLKIIYIILYFKECAKMKYLLFISLAKHLNTLLKYSHKKLSLQLYYQLSNKFKITYFLTNN